MLCAAIHGHGLLRVGTSILLSYLLLLKILGCPNYLAAKGAESEGVEEAAVADTAGVGDALGWPGLRAMVEEHYLGAVDNVGLNPCYVQVLLNLTHPYHIMI